MAKEKPIGLVDLDGTLADFDGALLKKMKEIASPGEEDVAPLLMNQENEPDYIRARRRLIKSQPGFWRELPPRTEGFSILRAMQELDFNIHILTNGPKTLPAAWQEKREWCDIHVPDLPVIIGRNKGLVYGRVLADDWPEYIEMWLEHRPRGLVIMPAQPWNKTFTHPNVVRYDGTNYAEVVARLGFARERTS